MIEEFTDNAASVCPCVSGISASSDRYRRKVGSFPNHEWALGAHEKKEYTRHVVSLYHGSEKQTLVYSAKLCPRRATRRIYCTEAGGSGITELDLHYQC